MISLTSSPVGDEVASVSAARDSGIPATSAIVTPRVFGCGCAAAELPDAAVGVDLLPFVRFTGQFLLAVQEPRVLS
jgi:hypothetical protein